MMFKIVELLLLIAIFAILPIYHLYIMFALVGKVTASTGWSIPLVKL
jgi:hypothetical protein